MRRSRGVWELLRWLTGENNLIGTLNPVKHMCSERSRSCPQRRKAAVATLRAQTSWAFLDTTGQDWRGPAAACAQLSFLTWDRLHDIPASTPRHSDLLDSPFPGLRALEGQGRGEGKAAHLPACHWLAPVTQHRDYSARYYYCISASSGTFTALFFKKQK